MKYLLDTNVYIEATRSELTRAQFRSVLPGMLNDVLIALCARQIGATLLTYNRDDFLLIQRHLDFSLRALTGHDPGRTTP